MTRFPNKMKDIKLNEIPVTATVVKFSMPWQFPVCKSMLLSLLDAHRKDFAKHMSVIIVNSPNN